MKKEIKIEGEVHKLSPYEFNCLLTNNAKKLYRKVSRQGGTICFGFGSIKNELKNQ